MDELLDAKRGIQGCFVSFLDAALALFSFIRRLSSMANWRSFRRTNLSCFVVTHFNSQSTVFSLIMTRNLNKVSSKLHVDSFIPNFHGKLLRIYFTREMFQSSTVFFMA